MPVRIKIPRLSWPTVPVTSAVMTAWTFLVVDSMKRSNWEGVSLARHFGAALLLYTAIGAAVGLSLWTLVGAVRSVRGAFERRWPRLDTAVGPAVCGALAVLAAHDAAFWVFTGAKVRHTPLSTWGPYAFMVAIAAAAVATTAATELSLRRLKSGRRRWALLWLGLCALLVPTVVIADLTLFVALYARLHTVLEVMAWALLIVVWTILIVWPRRSGKVVRWVARGCAVVALTWAGAYVAARQVRNAVEDSLKHVWLEEVYLGRMLRRAQDLASFVASPGGWARPEMQRLARLREKYDLGSTGRSRIWDQPFREPKRLTEQIRKLRGEARDLNILIYYVDTLRYDVGSDPRLMPNTSRFARSALDFVKTYSTGSDTLRGLPGLTDGSYDLKAVKPNGLLTVAKRAEIPTALVIAQSAYEFLDKLRPSFRFDETLTIRDYDAARKVWGYGADAPTAATLVDRAMEWIDAHGTQRFFLWVFNFDLHAWREIGEPHIDKAARALDVPREGALPHRYRVVARDIDEQFGRLLAELEARGLDSRTLVVMVADHGEALGRDGFMVHSVFLWESLVHVPLRLRIPGIPAARVESTVSLVDLAPTLARYMLPDPDMSDYHGEDLLGMLVPDRPARRLPILMAATSKMDLARIGIVDPDAPWKLVLPFESAVPELYRLEGSDPDRVNFADQHPARALRMLNRLVESPLFPRKPDDFKAYIR